MSQEMVPSNSANLTPYELLFGSPKATQAQVMAAASRLAVMLDKVVTPLQLQGWAQQLEKFSPDQLIYAFNKVEMTRTNWPKVGDLINTILDAEFLADYSWLLSNLKIHGAKWRDRGAVLGEPRRSDSNEPDKLYVRDVIEPAVKAPEIPDRLQEALYALGNGDQARGRELLSRHPFASGGEIDLREKRQLDESFRAAWDGVRVREIAGVMVASGGRRVR